ncbi:hypothetical protein [Marinilabilia rubra]|uniref:DUF4129 domain-containing protein n=1 Tax=Marinilabilia rubra TaxID=2162893 RepID=A0A2U2BDH4_9BACT|nr:hypothetical protein [Marinilabilia rubra]PWE01111.1 hypothetical protein DDZ16_01080 [Marinilabilia rubra]
MLQRLLFFIVLLSLWAAPETKAAVHKDSLAQDKVSAWDEGAVYYRQPPYEQIEEWKSDKKYRYDRGEGPGLLDYLLSRFLYWLVSQTSDKPWYFYVFVAIGALLILFLILRLLDVPVTGLFMMSRHPQNTGLQYQDEAFDFSSEKLRQMLDMFRNNGAYREAVRVLFLLYLRNLHDKGVVTLKHFKTNHDYLHEIDSEKERKVFRQRMHFFDVVWYGHTDVNEAQFNKVEAAFANSKEGGARL